MDIAALERSFGELLAAFGDVVVARSRGEPADPGGGSTIALVRRYRSRRRAFGGALHGTAEASGLSGEDARALVNMRRTLERLDEVEPTPRLSSAGTGPGGEEPAVARARAALSRRFGAAAGAVPVGRATMDLATVLSRLATEPDPATRRALFESLALVWRVVDGDGGDASPYWRLSRSSAERWRAHGSPVEAGALALGMPPGSIEGTLQAILAAWRTLIGADRLEPWDFRYAVGAAARRLGRLGPATRLLDLNRRYLASLGADPRRLGVTYDVLPRRGRPVIPVAFTTGMGGHATDEPAVGPWKPRPPWVFATCAEGSLGDLRELLRQSSRALHLAAVRTRPAFLDWGLADAAFLEGTASVVGWDADEPAWQRHWLGEAVDERDAILGRYGSVVLDVAWALFEIELHRHPDRRPNDVWAEVTTYGLGIEPHPEWSWWAVRGQLIDRPGYHAAYAMSAIVASAIRERVWDLRGPWWAGDPGWYAFMSEGLFTPGASRSSAALLEALLGRPLSAGPLLADLRRAR